MVTNNYDFKTVTRLRMLCMKVLPTVYSDSLSYEEQVCKVTEKINQLVDTVNALPDYIVEVVKELIDAAGLEDIVRNVLADLYFINVKNPPAPFVAAKGDGATNDTAAIQALLNYAGLQRSYLFFPAGNYIVSGLTMVKNVSLVGLDRYSSIITLAPDSNRDLITGFVENASISNLTLNANMNGQTSNCSCLNATVDNALIDFVIFRNGYDSVVVENTNEFEGAYWMFDGIQHNALTLNGEGAVISNVIFKNASQLSSNTLIVINGNNKITGIYSNATIPNGVVITANGANVEGTILNATKTITGSNGNYVNIVDSNGINKYATNDTETYTGTKNINAAAGIEAYTGNKTTNAVNDTETLSGAKTITANEIVLAPTSSLQYNKRETTVNEYFNGLPIKDNDRDTFLLVPGNGNIKDDINSVRDDINSVRDDINSVRDDINSVRDDINSMNDMPFFGYFFTPYCESAEYYPQGTCLLDDNTMVCFYSDPTGNTNTAILQKVDVRTGAILLTKTVENAYHGNSLTYVPETNEIFSVRYYENGITGKSNQIIVINPDTLTISRTFIIPGVSSIACLNYQNGKLYLSDRTTFVTFYSCNIDGSEMTKLFTSTFSTTWLSFTDRNLNVWYTNGFNMLVCSDLTGKVIGTYNLDFYSADYSTVRLEMESFMETSDGELLFTDMAYKRTVSGIYRRHVVNSFNKSIVKGQPINWNIRAIAIMPAIATSNTYHPFQNGYGNNNAYDSIEYASKIASAIPGSLVTLDGNAEVYDQWLVIRSDRVLMLNRMTIQGMIVDYSTVGTTNGLIIKSGGAELVAEYADLPRPTCLALWRWSRFLATAGNVDGENKPGVNGVYQGPMSLSRISGRRIINCAVPIYGRWSDPSTFGGYTTDFIGDALSNQYNLEQYGNVLYTRFGSIYGRKTKVLTGINFSNWTPQKFNAKNFFGQMMSIVVNNVTYTFDLTASNRCLISTVLGATHVDIAFSVTVTNAEDGATINLTSIASVPGGQDLSQFVINKIALW